MSDRKIAARLPVVLELDPGTYYWCRCGRSERQPYCDGSHKGTGIEPLEFAIEEKKKYAMCLCKRTGREPFCDGKHKTLSED